MSHSALQSGLTASVGLGATKILAKGVRPTFNVTGRPSAMPIHRKSHGTKLRSRFGIGTATPNLMAKVSVSWKNCSASGPNLVATFEFQVNRWVVLLGYSITGPGFGSPTRRSGNATSRRSWKFSSGRFPMSDRMRNAKALKSNGPITLTRTLRSPSGFQAGSASSI